METLVLSDKSVVPSETLVFSILGDKSALWQKLMRLMHEKYPDAVEQWNYYNDGKSWLFRILRKKKTMFWIGVLKDTFRITFYFGDKAELPIEKSVLPASMKHDFFTSKRYGKFRGLSILVAGEADIDHAITLAEIKNAV